MNPITLSEMSDEVQKLLEVMHWIFSSSPSNHILMLKCTEILMVFRTCN